MVKAGADPTAMETALEVYLNKQPKVSDTSNKMMGKSMEGALKKAGQYKKEFGDSFVSVEHLFLAITDIDGPVKSELRKMKVRFQCLFIVYRVVFHHYSFVSHPHHRSY